MKFQNSGQSANRMEGVCAITRNEAFVRRGALDILVCPGPYQNSNANRDAHAMLTMLGETKIENAHNGVILGRTAFPFGNSCAPPSTDPAFPPYLVDFGGGILIADNSGNVFEKNGIGIRILPYRFANLTSRINGVNFIGGTLLDIFYNSNTANPYTIVAKTATSLCAN